MLQSPHNGTQLLLHGWSTRRARTHGARPVATGVSPASAAKNAPTSTSTHGFRLIAGPRHQVRKVGRLKARSGPAKAPRQPVSSRPSDMLSSSEPLSQMSAATRREPRPASVVSPCGNLGLRAAHTKPGGGVWPSRWAQHRRRPTLCQPCFAARGAPRPRKRSEPRATKVEVSREYHPTKHSCRTVSPPFNCRDRRLCPL